MAHVKFETDKITDWESFHQYSKEIFGFPDFYGKNMDARIDCLTYIEENDGMSKFHLSKDEMLNVEVTETEDFNARLPDIFDALVECTAFVNSRYKRAVIAIVFTEKI